MTAEKLYNNFEVLVGLTKYAELVAKHGPSSLVDPDGQVYKDLVNLLDLLKDKNVISLRQYYLCTMLSDMTLENCGVYVFPYWRFSKSAVMHMIALRDHLNYHIRESNADVSEKILMFNFVNSLNETSLQIAKGPAYITNEQRLDLRTAINTVDLIHNDPSMMNQMNEMSSSRWTFSGGYDLVHCQNSDVNGGFVYDVPTSIMQCGRFYFSSVMCLRTEEERLLSNNYVLAIMYAFVFSFISDISKPSGVFNWKLTYLPKRKIIYFCYDLAKGNWFQISTDDHHNIPSTSILSFPEESKDLDVEGLFARSRSFAQLMSLRTCYGERCANLYKRDKDLFKKITSTFDARTYLCIEIDLFSEISLDTSD